MSKSLTAAETPSRRTSVPPIVAHMVRPQPKSRPQPLVGILAELANAGNY